MALSADKKAMLQSWAARGDIMSQEALALGEGAAGFVNVGTPAAKSTTGVHAAVYGDAVGPVTVTTALTNPAQPRNVTVTAGATWDGGTVTVVGTNQYGKAVTETITPTPGSTVAGTKIFKTVTSFSYAGSGTGTHATNTASVGTGDKLGLLIDVLDSFGLGMVDGVPEAVTMDSTLDAVTFLTTAPNGSKVFTLLCNR